MPERRHLWRGIHDKATVLSGVAIALEQVTTDDGRVSGVLTLSNKGVGHQFPTYVTPRVVMEAYQLDGDGQSIPETRRERIIARQVSLDLSQELFDTRLAPGQTARLIYEATQHPQARAILFRIQVEPDNFYREFYQATLENGSSLSGATNLRDALHNAEASIYTLYRQEIPL